MYEYSNTGTGCLGCQGPTLGFGQVPPTELRAMTPEGMKTLGPTITERPEAAPLIRPKPRIPAPPPTTPEDEVEQDIQQEVSDTISDVIEEETGIPEDAFPEDEVEERPSWVFPAVAVGSLVVIGGGIAAYLMLRK